MKYRVELGFVAAMFVPGLVACGDGGFGSAETSAAMSAVWNPCTEIPEDIVRAADLVPATRDSGIPRPLHSGQEICRWYSPGYSYSVTVFSTNRTVTEVERQQPKDTDFQDVTVADRAGRQFAAAGASEHLNCNLLFAAEQGAVRIQILLYSVPAQREEPCRRADVVGGSLVSALPR